MTSYNDLLVVVVGNILHGVHKPFPFGEASHQLGNGHACIDHVAFTCQRVSVYDNEYHCGREQYFVRMSCCEDRCSKLWALFARTMEGANPICCSGAVCSTNIRIQRGSEYVSAIQSSLID